MFIVRKQADWGQNGRKREVHLYTLQQLSDGGILYEHKRWKFNQIMSVTFFFFLYFVGSCELHGLEDVKMCLPEKQLIDTQLIDMCQWDI